MLWCGACLRELAGDLTVFRVPVVVVFDGPLEDAVACELMCVQRNAYAWVGASARVRGSLKAGLAGGGSEGRIRQNVEASQKERGEEKKMRKTCERRLTDCDGHCKVDGLLRESLVAVDGVTFEGAAQDRLAEWRDGW